MNPSAPTEPTSNVLPDTASDHELPKAQGDSSEASSKNPASPSHNAAISTDTSDNSNDDIVVPDTADDTDLIEKEWVIKAQQVIEKLKDDPYQQSKQLNVVKAEYMKKRYNKSLKLS
jgi:hypothetical protein